MVFNDFSLRFEIQINTSCDFYTLKIGYRCEVISRKERGTTRMWSFDLTSRVVVERGFLKRLLESRGMKDTKHRLGEERRLVRTEKEGQKS